MAIQWVPTFAEAHSGAPASFSCAAVPHANPADTAFYQFGFQWNMDAIHAPEAWALTTGSDDIRVGVLDTGGSPTHLDLTGKYDQSVCKNFTFQFDLNTGIQIGPLDPADWQDRHFHGTHVSGTIAGNSIGVAAVAP